MDKHIKMDDVLSILNRQMQYREDERDNDGAGAIDDCISAILAELCGTNLPAGELLTLEQLREMDGQPVWIVRLEDNLGWWAIVRLRNDRANTDYGAYFMISDYGKTWIAYAYHPGHIDRSEWVPFETIGGNKGVMCKKCGYREYDHVKYTTFLFCPECGSPMTPDACAVMEKRLMGVRV